MRRPGPIIAAAWLVAALVTVASIAWAWDASTPTQHGVSRNAMTTSAVNTAVSITLTPLGGDRARVYGLSAFCSAGTASLSITNAGASGTGWVSSSALVTTASVGVAWTPVPFTGSQSGALVVTLGACGGGNTGTLMVQGDTFAP